MELICTVKNYHWGKKGKDSLVGKFANENSDIMVDDEERFAELWIGTHPSGPSFLKSSKMPLSQHIEIHAEELGSKVINTFGNHLPFLFKILSVEEPLSIQAHPNKALAEELKKKYPNIYKDNNHKPEMAIAATQFEALCGFRPKSEIKKFLRNIPEFRLLISAEKIDRFLKISEENSEESTEAMKVCFQSLMVAKEEDVSPVLKQLLKRLETLNQEQKAEYLFDLVSRIYPLFPNDVGVLCVYWFNYIVLSPGEAIYLAPNEPHAYLHGDCFECMANSDNVVRAGLTPKFRDVSTLCQMLSYKNYAPSEILFQPVLDEFSYLYVPPVKDFAVTKIELPKNCEYKLKKRDSASILVVLEGHGEINSIPIKFGKVLYFPVMSEIFIKSHGVIIFQVLCNV